MTGCAYARVFAPLQLPQLCTQTLSFLETTAQSKFVDTATQAVATAVLDHPTALHVLDRTFGPRDAVFKPITDVVMVQSGEPVPPGYTLVSNTFMTLGTTASLTWGGKQLRVGGHGVSRGCW